MIKFDLSIHIYRPIQQVFEFVSTPENDFHWQYGTFASARVTKEEVGVGTLFRSVEHFMGRRMESVYEVTEFEPAKKYGFRSQSGSIASSMLYTFDVSAGSTRVNVSAQINLGASFKPGDAATEKKVKKQYRENLDLLKDVLEANPADELAGPGIYVSHRRR
jgi:hypothetical protein